MIDRTAILGRLHGAEDDALVDRLRAWLRRDDTQLISARIARPTVSEAHRLWSTRLKNTALTGQHLEGAESLLAKLEHLTPQRKLEQFALSGPHTSGNLFFDGSTHTFVGAILFDTRNQRKRA
jgi:hypothetical protein